MAPAQSSRTEPEVPPARLADSAASRGALLGAHVSIAGGVRNAPIRAAEIGASAIQIFTKMASRWAEPSIDPEEALAFRRGCADAGVVFACSHDSYLINLASPDAVLRNRSFESFRLELLRAGQLGLDAVVTHPGNATDGDFDRALRQNAALIGQALEETDPGPMVLLETTAGSGRVLGWRFEQIAALRAAVPAAARGRVGVCLDTCHVYCAGYDIRDGYDAVMDEFERVVGLEHLKLFHLNDSQKPFGCRADRHEGIGLGALGDEPFRRIMRDARFARVPKVIETPKGDDHAATDRRNLARLRAYLE